MKKILFMRHAESVDDLTDQYGGWADFALTPNGALQVNAKIQVIKDLDEKFDIALTSPLSRAQESGRIIANALSIPMETFLYVKEKNGYGLLSGLNKGFASTNYPELVEALEAGYVFGSEPQDQFEKRVAATVLKLEERKEDNIIVITHGGFLKELFRQFLDKTVAKAHDAGFALMNLQDSKLELIKFDGIDLE